MLHKYRSSYKVNHYDALVFLFFKYSQEILIKMSIAACYYDS